MPLQPENKSLTSNEFNDNYIANATIILPPALIPIVPPLEPLNFDYISLPFGPTQSTDNNITPLTLPPSTIPLQIQNVAQAGEINQQHVLEMFVLQISDMPDSDSTFTAR